MKKYRFKKVLLVIACFSLVIVMTACGSGGSHASISTDPDNPSELTFPETAEDGTFYQSIYNSNADDQDAEPGTIYGCYNGTFNEGSDVIFVVSKPKLPNAIAQALSDNGLKYFVISAMIDDEDYSRSHDTIYAFKDEASYDVTSHNQETITAHGRFIGMGLGTEDNYMEIGSIAIDDENFSTCSTSNEDGILSSIDYLVSH